jgi:hypothetical protein
MRGRDEIEARLREAAREHWEMRLSIADTVAFVAAELEAYHASLRIHDPRGIIGPPKRAGKEAPGATRRRELGH